MTASVASIHALEPILTPLLKILLHSYGSLYVTIATLEKERPGVSHASLEEYYESLGKARPGEGVLCVRISQDEEIRYLHQSADELPPDLHEKYGQGDVTIMELPEDEYYFFKGFRPGLFELEKQVPPFIMQMALVHAYSIFENYIADVIRILLTAHPALVGLKKQISFAELLESSSKESLVGSLIEGEVSQIMYKPVRAILDSLRNKFGLRNLTNEHDDAVELLSLTRNCLMHNGSNVDPSLAAVDTTRIVGQPIEIDLKAVGDAIYTYRRICLSIDRALEGLGSTITND